MNATHRFGILFALLLCPALALAQRPPTTAPSRVTGVTVYRGSALVTRQVEVPAGTGLIELVVTPLPPQTLDSSLYSEGINGIRVLSTRYRTRAVKDDIRAEVRAKEEQLKSLQLEAERIQKRITVIDQDLALLGKLENFTGATMQQLAEKGLLSADTTIALAKHVMETRSTKVAEQVQLQQQLRGNAESVQFAQRELAELAAGSGKTERDAVITIDKGNAPAGTLRLNYLVGGATWNAQYKLRAGIAAAEPVQVEYLAAIQQGSGEDWNDVDISLSTAEPMLNAAPPDLLAMDVTVGRVAAGAAGGLGGGGRGGPALTLGADNRAQSQQLRQEAQRDLNFNNDLRGANGRFNTAAALEQTEDLFGVDRDNLKLARGGDGQQREGPSVTYHLSSKFSLPSRNDEQLLEIARIQITPTYYYKAIPVLTPHVYRLADLVNSSSYVLLPGEATMYQGTDFVGRMQLPLVAIGEEFTAGFGADPQLQVTRELAKKNRTLQGGNQVHELQYRIRLSSFKTTPVTVQVWDRLPRGDVESVGVSLLNSAPALSADPEYTQKDRPANLLRWDMTLEPGANGQKAGVIDYTFKLEYDRNVSLGNFKVGG